MQKRQLLRNKLKAIGLPKADWETRTGASVVRVRNCLIASTARICCQDVGVIFERARALLEAGGNLTCVTEWDDCKFAFLHTELS